MTPATSALHRSARSSAFVKLAFGFTLIYLVLDRSATWTNSLFGEYGVLICALVIAAALLVERLLFGTMTRHALAILGFGRPSRRGLLAALLASLALLAYLPLFMLVTGQPLTLRDGWPWIALGVLLQGGVAEELLWRGYLFRHLRATRSFWHAATIGMLFMVAQHTLLLGVCRCRSRLPRWWWHSAPPFRWRTCLSGVATPFGVRRCSMRSSKAR